MLQSGPHRPAIAQQFANFALVDREQRTHVDTQCATYYLGRKPQTMRVWASVEKGSIQPIKNDGQLSWSIAEIRQLLSKS